MTNVAGGAAAQQEEQKRVSMASEDDWEEIKNEDVDEENLEQAKQNIQIAA